MKIKPLIFGISSTFISIEEREFLENNPIYGFILFKRNIDSAPQLHALIAELRNLYPDKKTYIFIDQEGGRVARLKHPLISRAYPTGNYFSELYDQQGSVVACDSIKINYKKLTEDIRFYDIDSPCAPVADLIYSYTDVAIGDRSFGSYPQKVVELCSAAITGITAAGGFAIIKHIPGHGRATCDSHFELPRVKASLTELENTDFAVFKELAKNKNIHFAMTAHIIFDALDPDMPATISAKIIQYIRDKIGFNGIIITDDLSMLALHGRVGKDYAAVKKAILATEQNDFIEAKKQLKNHLGVSEEILDLPDAELTDYINNLLERLKIKYLESLKNVANQAIKAGCDLVLHCSGDLEEMKIIANAVDVVNLKPILLN